MKTNITPEILNKRFRDIILKTIFKESYRGLGFIFRPIYSMGIKESEITKTISIDIKNMDIIYNKDFISEYINDDNMMLGLLIHEMFHVIVFSERALGDPSIIKEVSNNRIIANIAQDLVINNIIANHMSIDVPPVGVIPKRDDNGSYRLYITKRETIYIKNINDKSWIEIYREIMEKVKDKEETIETLIDMKAIVDEGITFEDEDHNGKNQGIGEILSNSDKIISSIKKSLDEIKNKGDIPYGNRRVIKIMEQMLMIKNNYEAMLFNKMRKMFSGNSMRKSTKLNKKEYMKKNIYYDKEPKGIECYVVVDVSGSMQETTIVNSINIIYKIMKTIGGKLNICSYDIKKVDEKTIKGKIKSIKELNIGISKGGTNIKNMLKHLYDIKNKNVVRILITDMMDTVNENEYKKLDILITDNRNTKLKNAIIV